MTTENLDIRPKWFKNKRNLIIIAFVTVFAAVLGAKYGRDVFASNVPKDLKEEYVYIPTGATYEQVLEIIKTKKIVHNLDSFDWLAQQLHYKQPVMRAGRYKIKKGWSNYDLVNHLKKGEQASVKVVLNYERQTENIAAKAGKALECDSLEIVTLFKDSAFLAAIGYNADELMSVFVPNTYDFLWNTDAKKFIERMVKEHDAFWQKNDRKAKAEALNLTPNQAYALASIVEKESQNQEERPRIAAVYLNRLKIGMKLQADPTCVFASKDFETRRVVKYHLEFNSPYNTYLHEGLPPGPISIASASSIDAVLNPEEHHYLYFCARADNSGTHAFAETLSGHNVNVNKYINFLNSKGITH